MKTKMMSLIAILFMVIVSATVKAQPTITVENQLGCSVIVNVTYYTTAFANCGSSVPVAFTSSQTFNPPPACGTMLGNVAVTVTDAGGAISSPPTANFTNGAQTFMPSSITCNGTTSAIVYNNGPNNFKIY